MVVSSPLIYNSVTCLQRIYSILKKEKVLLEGIVATRSTAENCERAENNVPSDKNQTEKSKLVD